MINDNIPMVMKMSAKLKMGYFQMEMKSTTNPLMMRSMTLPKPPPITQAMMTWVWIFSMRKSIMAMRMIMKIKTKFIMIKRSWGMGMLKAMPVFSL